MEKKVIAVSLHVKVVLKKKRQDDSREINIILYIDV